MRGHGLGVLQGATGFEIGGNARCSESVTAADPNTTIGYIDDTAVNVMARRHAAAIREMRRRMVEPAGRDDEPPMEAGA